jgi:hypothetical protein
MGAQLDVQSARYRRDDFRYVPYRSHEVIIVNIDEEAEFEDG